MKTTITTKILPLSQDKLSINIKPFAKAKDHVFKSIVDRLAAYIRCYELALRTPEDGDIYEWRNIIFTMRYNISKMMQIIGL